MFDRKQADGDEVEEGQGWISAQWGLIEGEEDELEVAKPDEIKDCRCGEVDDREVEGEDGE